MRRFSDNHRRVFMCRDVNRPNEFSPEPRKHRTSDLTNLGFRIVPVSDGSSFQRHPEPVVGGAARNIAQVFEGLQQAVNSRSRNIQRPRYFSCSHTARVANFAQDLQTTYQRSNAVAVGHAQTFMAIGLNISRNYRTQQ